jgi:hypothetical protein
MAHIERAELATEEYFSYSHILEGLVILKKCVVARLSAQRVLMRSAAGTNNSRRRMQRRRQRQSRWTFPKQASSL